jgi:hypothetical protein
MKIIALLILLSCPVLAQQTDTITLNKMQFITGEVYLDSVWVDMDKTFLDPDNILEVRSYAGDGAYVYSHAPRATFITRKEKTELTRLDNFYKKDLYPIKFIVDGKNIQNPSEIYIETSGISGVTILNATQGVMHDPPSITLIITIKADKAADKN